MKRLLLIALLLVGCVDRGNGIQCVLDPLTLEQRRADRAERGVSTPFDRLVEESQRCQDIRVEVVFLRERVRDCMRREQFAPFREQMR